MATPLNNTTLRAPVMGHLRDQALTQILDTRVNLGNLDRMEVRED